MSREDLVQVNAGIVGGVVEQVVKLSPNAILLMMTNPLDTIMRLVRLVETAHLKSLIADAHIEL